MHNTDLLQMLIKNININEFTNKDNIIPSTFIGLSIIANSFLHMFYIGFTNPNYFKCLITNTVLICLMIVTHIFIKYRGIIDNQNYSWLNVLFDLPLASFIMTNILATKHDENNNGVFTYPNPFYPIDTDELFDTNIDQDNESDETDESDESTESDESNESNQTCELNQDNILEEDDNDIDQDDSINKVLVEKYNNYMNSVIYEYEYKIAEIKESMRFNSKDVSNIKLVLENKISERDYRILVRTINMIIQDKIINTTEKTGLTNIIVSEENIQIEKTEN